MKTILASIPIFKDLNETELKELEKISTLNQYQRDNILFYEGDTCTHLHIVVDGVVELYKVNNNGKEVILKRFAPYSFIAEVANYTAIPYPASARAMIPSEVIAIDYAAFEKQFLYHPLIIPHIFKSVVSKVRTLEKFIASNVVMDAKARIAKFIYDNETLFLTQKHHKIAEMMNITPITFSRILKQFKEKGILTKEGNETLIDKNLLKKAFS